jgi:hypothetical protein
MARLLCVIQDTFEIQGRGLVFHPGILLGTEENFRVGDVLRYVSPDGRVVDRRIESLSIPLGLPPRSDGKVELFITSKDAAKEDLPVGTEVWSTDESF